MSQELQYQIKSVNLGLDKLTLTATPPNMNQYANYAKELASAAHFDDDFTFAGHIAKNGYRAAVRLKVSGAPSTVWPLLQVDPYGKSAYFRLECNPNRLGPDGIEEMKSIIDTNTPHGWALFMQHARASRIDANIDAQGLLLRRVLLTTKYPRCTEMWTQRGELDTAVIGDVKTVYLGQKAVSNTVFRIYQLPDSKIETGCTAATRFESFDSGTRPKLSNLHEYTFPFAKLVVRSALAPKPAGWHDGHWEMFIRVAGDHGLNTALQHLTAEERKQADKALAAVPMADLDLEQCWSQWPALLDKLGLQKPGIGGHSMPSYSNEFIKDNSSGKLAA